MNHLRLFPLIIVISLFSFISINSAYCHAPTMSNYVSNNLIIYDGTNVCSVEYYDYDGWNNVTSVDVLFQTFGNTESVTLRWTPLSGFSELSDTSGISTLIGGSFTQIGLQGGIVEFEWSFNNSTEYGSGDYKFTVTDNTALVTSNWIYDRIFVWDEAVGDLLIIWKSTMSNGFDSQVDTSYWSNDTDHIRNWDYSTDFDPLDMIAEDAVTGDTLNSTASVNTNELYVWNENLSSQQFSSIQLFSWNPTDYDYSFNDTSSEYEQYTGGEGIDHLGLIEDSDPASAKATTSSVNTNKIYVWSENLSVEQFTSIQMYGWNPTNYAYSLNITSPEYQQFTAGGTAIVSNLGLLEMGLGVPDVNISINDVFLNETEPFGFWLFRADVYEMKAYTHNTSFTNITFSDTLHTMVFSYDKLTNNGKVTVTGFNDPNQNMNVIGLASSSWVTGSGVNETVYTWKFIPNNNIVDCYNQTVSYIGGNSSFNITGSCVTKLNIYNLGGKVAYSVTGDGHHIVGGDVFEIGATNGATGSSAKASAVYRRLQQIHLLGEWYFAPDIINGEELDEIASGGELEYRFDYAINNVWIEGWKCIITPVDSNVGTHGIGADASWIKFAIGWYNQGVLIKTEYIMSYDFAYDTDSNFPTLRPTTTFWVDLWFNKMNSSSVVGGRVNAEYHGMYEETGWWFSSDFRPIFTNVTSSMFFTNLKDGIGDDMSCFNINLVKVSTTLRKLDRAVTNGNLWKTMPYQILDLKVAGDRMEGINTPVFVETRTLDIPSTGFFAPIVSAIGGIATAIFVSALGFMRVLIGSVDTFLAIFGVPSGTFSSLISMVVGTLTTVMSWFTIALTQLQNMLTLFGALITNMTTLVNYAVNVLLWTFTNVFTMPLQVIALLLAVINGTSITFYGILLDFTPYASLMAGAKQILPLTIGIALLSYIIYGNMSLDGDEDMANAPKRVIGLFMGLRDTFDGIFWMYNRIRAIIMNMISAIKAWIPSMSGGMPSGENTV